MSPRVGDIYAWNYTGFMGPEEFRVVEVDADDGEVFIEYEDGECEVLDCDEFLMHVDEGLISPVFP